MVFSAYIICDIADSWYRGYHAAAYTRRDRAGGPRIQQLSDALAIVRIDQNVDVEKIPASLGAIWGLLSYPNPLDPTGSYGKAANYVGEMIAPPSRYRMGSHIKTNKSISLFPDE